MKDEEILAASQELESARLQLDTLERQMELIRVTREEYTRARDALLDLKDRKPGEEVLVPIGANCWVRATLGDTGRAIASIGSGMAVGQSTEDIIEMLERQLKSISQAESEINERSAALEARSLELTRMLQKEYARMEQAAAGQ